MSSVIVSLAFAARREETQLNVRKVNEPDMQQEPKNQESKRTPYLYQSWDSGRN